MPGQPVGAGDDSLRNRHGVFTGEGRTQRPGGSVEQSELKVLLDLPDQETDGRLGHTQFGRGFGEAAMAIDQHERFELPHRRGHEVTL